MTTTSTNMTSVVKRSAVFSIFVSMGG